MEQHNSPRYFEVLQNNFELHNKLRKTELWLLPGPVRALFVDYIGIKGLLKIRHWCIWNIADQPFEYFSPPS